MFKTDMSTTEVMLTDSQRTALDHALADARECLERDGGMCPFSVLCTSDGFVVTDHPGEGVDDIYNSVRALVYEVEDGVYHFADAPASAGTAKPLYPRGTKPIVSGLVEQASERAEDASGGDANEQDGERENAPAQEVEE